MFIDSHCHLDFDVPQLFSFASDQQEVIDRARAAGISTMINVGCDLESSRLGLELAKRYEFIWCTLGVHPNDSETWSRDVFDQFLCSIEASSNSNSFGSGSDHTTEGAGSHGDGPFRSRSPIVAIGEIGLDYFRKGASTGLQQEVFRAQLRLAKRAQLPVVIHCREAFDDVVRILQEEAVSKAVFHCYSGNLKQAQFVWSQGWMTSFTAVVSYPKNDELRRVVQAAPADRYFLETDAPFLPHQSIRGKRNEPAYLLKLADLVAELRAQTLEAIGQETTRNVREFFNLPEPNLV